MIVYDDLEQSEKIKVYDKGITLNRQKDPAEKMYQALVGYRTGDMLAPQPRHDRGAARRGGALRALHR